LLRDPPPPTAPADRVFKFQQDHVGGPTKGEPVLIDWTSPLSSTWNREATCVLAVSFLDALRAGTIKSIQFNDNMSIKAVQDSCVQKLTKVRTAYTRVLRMDTDTLESKVRERAKRNRVNTRRHGVSANYFLCKPENNRLPQTRQRRAMIIDQHFDGNPEFWTEVQDLLESLGSDGMSSDESDQEGPVKKLRRVRKGWVSEEVSGIWRVIECYHRDQTKDMSTRGNSALERDFTSRCTSFNAVKAGLPRNYYDGLWWQSLIVNDQLMLQPKSLQNLPKVNL